MHGLKQNGNNGIAIMHKMSMPKVVCNRIWNSAIETRASIIIATRCSSFSIVFCAPCTLWVSISSSRVWSSLVWNSSIRRSFSTWIPVCSCCLSSSDSRVMSFSARLVCSLACFSSLDRSSNSVCNVTEIIKHVICHAFLCIHRINILSKINK